MERTRWMKALALLVALASLTINFGLIDLIDGYTGFVDQARNQVLDAGWGLVFGVILPIALLAQLRRPQRRIAGIQQTGIVALALAAAAVIGEARWYVALAGESRVPARCYWRCIPRDGRSLRVAGAWSR
jgi:peptidoglycan/LPS O-acetylase OafA/YrhL